MNTFLLDTHVLVWAFREPGRLSATVVAALASPGVRWIISAISLVEMRYLIERWRIPAIMWDEVQLRLGDGTGQLSVLPVDVAVAEALERIPRNLVPDMPDRIIAATALSHNLPLVTQDRKIQSAPGLTIIW